MSKEFNTIVAGYCNLRRELHNTEDSHKKLIIEAKLNEPFKKLMDYYFSDKADDDDQTTLKTIVEDGIDKHYKDD